MEKNECIFLTWDQAMEAVRIDFRQYDPQILLFCEIIRLIFRADRIVEKEPGKNGVWIRKTGQQTMRWLEGPDLVEYMCEALAAADLTFELLQSICARVFRTRAVIGVHPETGRQGIFIETGMEGYACRQCGHCCRSLDYHAEVTATDVARWRESGRHDILEWVGIFNKDNRETVYRIWTVPGTKRLAENCPFLHKIPTENRWVCRIHDIKPEICRNYPVSRKHALMTGCPGFDR